MLISRNNRSFIFYHNVLFIFKTFILYCSRTVVEAETPILWTPDVKSWLIWKDPDAGKDWGQEEKGTMEDKMVGWHHQLNGHGFGWTPGVGDGQGGLVCCGSGGRKESDMTEWLNWTDCWLTTWWFQVDSKGTQPYVYTYLLFLIHV